MKQCQCGRTSGGSQICLVMYGKPAARKQPSNGEAPGGVRVLGAIETARCERCLVRRAWKDIAITILITAVIMAAILGFKWAFDSTFERVELFGSTYRVTWYGWIYMSIPVIVFFIIRVVTTHHRVRSVGGAPYALARYKKQGFIHASDFIYLTETGRMMLAGGCIPLQRTAAFHPDMLTIRTECSMEAAVKPKQDNDEARMLRYVLEEAHRYASPAVVGRLPAIRRAFWKPLAMLFMTGFSLIGALVCSDMILDYLPDPVNGISVILIAVLYLGGMFLLVIRKRAIGYLPYIACAAMYLTGYWLADYADYADSRRAEHFAYNSVGLILMVIICFLLPALLWLPYIFRQKISQCMPRADKRKGKPVYDVVQ